MRRALIRARHRLIPELRALADQSPDPCIAARRPFAPLARLDELH
jgi:hypothetical protein